MNWAIKAVEKKTTHITSVGIAIGKSIRFAQKSHLDPCRFAVSIRMNQFTEVNVQGVLHPLEQIRAAWYFQ